MIQWVIQNKIIKRSIYAIEIIRFIIKNESWKFRIKIKYCQIFFSNITLQHFLRFFIYTFPCIFYSWLCNLCSCRWDCILRYFAIFTLNPKFFNFFTNSVCKIISTVIA